MPIGNIFKSRENEGGKNNEDPLGYWEGFENKQVTSEIRDIKGLYKDLLEVKVKIDLNDEGGFEINKESAFAKTEQINKANDSYMDSYHGMIKALNNLIGVVGLLDKRYDGAVMTVSELLDLAEKSALAKVEKEKSPESFSVN